MNHSHSIRSAVGGLLVAFLVSATAGAVQAAERGGRIMTFTRTATLFSGKEMALNEALRSHDAAGLEALVAADFELRKGDAPSEPVPRPDWLQLPAPNADARVGQIAVHDFGDTALVSFVLFEPVADNPDQQTETFLVDVWRKTGDDWRLAVRYAPGQDRAEPAQDAKPDGKG